MSPDVQVTTLITQKEVKARLGISEMTLWRRLNKYEELEFPKPITINNRNFFQVAEIEAWVKKQLQRTVERAGKRTTRSGKEVASPPPRARAA